MTANKTGLLIHFDENRRRDLIKEKVEGSYEPFSDALSVHDWEIGQLSIALLCFSDTTIDYIALAKKGKRVVTSKSRGVSLRIRRGGEIQSSDEGREADRYHQRGSGAQT